jgi:F-type H+-transporting ATPase subunit a
MRAILFTIASFLLISVYANPVVDHQPGVDGNSTIAKGEDPIEAIMNHVADANEYHIATIDGKHISIPLPCILFNKTAHKFSFFLSSTLQQKEEIEGYKLNEETGKVVDAQTGTRDTFIDFSITKNVFTMLLGFTILTLVFFFIKRTYSIRKNLPPKGIQALFEPVIQFLIDDVLKPNLGNRYHAFLPYILSIFFFILINNLLGLIPFFPGGANLSGNIAFTFPLAFIAFLMINLNGNKDYWKHIFAMPGVPKALLIILTPIEIMGVFLKPMVLMLRLFGNITGGHIAVLSIVSLIFILGELGKNIGGAIAGGAMAIPILLFVSALELFVTFLQAYVFTLLTATFIGMAMEEHHTEKH